MMRAIMAAINVVNCVFNHREFYIREASREGGNTVCCLLCNRAWHEKGKINAAVLGHRQGDAH